jgi:hypothetical protein
MMRKLQKFSAKYPACALCMSPVRLAPNTVCIPLYSAESAPTNDYRDIICIYYRHADEGAIQHKVYGHNSTMQ